MSRAKDAADLGALLSSATATRGKTAAAVVPAFVAAAAKEPTRRERLAQLEHVVETSALNFRRAQARHYREVGPALEEIRDEELYADAGYASWHDYLRRRWEYSEAHAYRFIEMGKVLAALSPLGDAALEALTAESHARELAPVLNSHGEEAVRQVWTEVTADPDRKVTAKRVAHVRDSLLGPREVSPIGGNSVGEVVDVELMDDGQDVADHLAAEGINRVLRQIADRIERIQRELADVACIVAEGGSPLDVGAAVNDLSRIRRGGRAISRTDIKF